MEDAPKDVLFRLAIEMALPELLNFCATSKKIDEKVCQRRDIWNYKLKNEFPSYDGWLEKTTPREVYTTLYGLTVLKEKLNIKETIKELYFLQKLDLNYNQIEEIPKELGNLTNLQRLSLSDNQIKEIPKEVANLTNLTIYK